jgi:hypothetical protein
MTRSRAVGKRIWLSVGKFVATRTSDTVGSPRGVNVRGQGPRGEAFIVGATANFVSAKQS